MSQSILLPMQMHVVRSSNGRIYYPDGLVITPELLRSTITTQIKHYELAALERVVISIQLPQAREQELIDLTADLGGVLLRYPNNYLLVR
jgi:hypothetical protein